MGKTLVVYYSRTGSNAYLAKRISKELVCDIEEIRPRIKAFLFLLMGSWLNISWGIKPIKFSISEYDRIVVCGPIWTGTLISPLRSFMKKYQGQIKNISFVTCCGSKDSAKNDKFGYGHVFRRVEKFYPNAICEAFPIDLVIPEDKKADDAFIMKTRLNDDNFQGTILERFQNFLTLVRAS